MSINICTEWSFPLFSYENIHHLNHQTVFDNSVIVQVVIYNCSLSLGGHLKTPLLAKGGEGIVDVQLTSLWYRPQSAKAWWCPGDVHIVVVVRWWVWVRVGVDWWLLLLGRRCAPRSPGARGDPTGGRRHLVVWHRGEQLISKSLYTVDIYWVTGLVDSGQ